jgi:hypothetical protein
MLYLVDIKADMERANAIDKGAGPGATFKKIVDRFHPQSMWGNAAKREMFLVVDLESPNDMAELMYALTWFTGGEPTFTPLMSPEGFDEAIMAAKKIVSPP